MAEPLSVILTEVNEYELRITGLGVGCFKIAKADAGWIKALNKAGGFFPYSIQEMRFDKERSEYIVTLALTFNLNRLEPPAD